MTYEHQRQLIGILKPIQDELDAGRLFEAQQIARLDSRADERRSRADSCGD